MKAVARRVPRWPELGGHGFAVLAKRMRMMVVLVADKELLVVFRVLSFGFTRWGIPAPKYKMYRLPSIVEVLSF